VREGVTAVADKRPERATEAPATLEAVFADLRREGAGTCGESEVGERHLRLAELCLHAGRVDLARRALMAAVEFVHHRFEASRRLAELAEAAGETDDAIGWYERAAAATAPSVEEGHRLLYGLARLLERAGHPARAPAVLLELQGVAGSYEDRTTRIATLSAQLEGG